MYFDDITKSHKQGRLISIRRPSSFSMKTRLKMNFSADREYTRLKWTKVIEKLWWTIKETSLSVHYLVLLFQKFALPAAVYLKYLKGSSVGP